MSPARRFSKPVMAVLTKDKILGVRAGSDGEHRFIGVWFVVVDGRLFIRSWGLERRSWYTAFCEDPEGTIQVGSRELTVRAVTSVPEKMKTAVDTAYAEKYTTPGAIQYVKGFKRSKRRRDRTTELVPR